MESFSMHLISNVSPGLFPDNNASKFSTNLANELNLSEGEWDVAVRQIMHPTRVATISEEDQIHVFKYKDDYRNLLSVPSEHADSLNEMGNSIYLNPPANKAQPDMLQHILNTVNNSVWSKDKGILKVEFNEQFQVLILYVLIPDIVVWMSKTTRKYLGFREDHHSFVKGASWAHNKLDKTLAPPTDLKLNLCDLRTLKKETHQLRKSWNGNRREYCYRKIIPNKFKSTLPNEYFMEPSFSFGVFPHEGFIRMFQLQSIPEKFKKHEDKIAFIQFDSLSSSVLDMNDIYCMNDFRPNDEQGYHGYYHDGGNIPTKIYKRGKQESPAVINVLKRPVLVNENFDNNGDYIAFQNISVTFYYASVVKLVRDLQEKPMATISVGSEKEIEEPNEMVPLLNSMAELYDYKFSYDAVSQRFEINVGKKYAIQLSDSLSSILGFGKSDYFHSKSWHRATTFPLLKRAITALYVYSNIVDAVYVGDVKAPLLLTCPFKRSDAFNIVHQQEFLNPCYVPLNRSHINQIDIAIYDDAGSLIPFLYGKTKLSLDFRRKR